MEFVCFFVSLFVCLFVCLLCRICSVSTDNIIMRIRGV
jgi:hypothetical protein